MVKAALSDEREESIPMVDLKERVSTRQRHSGPAATFFCLECVRVVSSRSYLRHSPPAPSPPHQSDLVGCGVTPLFAGWLSAAPAASSMVNTQKIVDVLAVYEQWRLPLRHGWSTSLPAPAAGSAITTSKWLFWLLMCSGVIPSLAGWSPAAPAVSSAITTSR